MPRCPRCASAQITVVISRHRRAFCSDCGARWVQDGSEQHTIKPAAATASGRCTPRAPRSWSSGLAAPWPDHPPRSPVSWTASTVTTAVPPAEQSVPPALRLRLDSTLARGGILDGDGGHAHGTRMPSFPTSSRAWSPHPGRSLGWRSTRTPGTVLPVGLPWTVAAFHVGWFRAMNPHTIGVTRAVKDRLRAAGGAAAGDHGRGGDRDGDGSRRDQQRPASRSPRGQRDWRRGPSPDRLTVTLSSDSNS